MTGLMNGAYYLRRIRALRAELLSAAQEAHVLAEHWQPWADCREQQCIRRREIAGKE